MKNYPLRFLMLSLLAACPAARAQSLPTDPSADSQPRISEECQDAANSTSEECTQNDEEQRRNNIGADYNTGVESGRSISTTTSAASESNTLIGKNRSHPLEQPLPPDLPTEFQKFVAATTGQLLPVYGASLFHNVPSTFAPVDLAPVTSGYVIGPEDEIRVRIWGQMNYSGNLRVDRSGDIYLPQAGAVHVAGLEFSALDQHLRQAVARNYRNFDLSVDIGQIRSMQIYVTGQARRPGVYTVSSLSSLVDALFASGGPSPQGSLRHIELNRDGKTISDFDLYALLVRGDKSKDVRLLPEDVLFIPAAGPQVALTGSVRSPGIYELRDGETIGNLLDEAGKNTAMSSATRISLDRVGPDQVREAMEFPFDASGLAAPLADGDILSIYPIVPAYQKTVTLRGNVANPGRFSFRPGMHLSDLIPDRDSLASRDYWWKRSHLGLPVPEFEPMISTIGRDPRSPESNRRNFTSSVSQETLTSALTRDHPQDSSDANNSQQSFDPSQQDSASDAAQAARAGQTGSSASVAAQLEQTPAPGAGQPRRNEVRLSSPEINWDYAVIERLDPETLKTSLIPFDLGKLVIDHDSSQDLALQAGDAITIFSQADIRAPLDKQTKYVALEGEFVRSGIYSVQPGETLRDVARRAGGLTARAYLYGSEFTRESTRVLQQQRLDEYVRSVGMESERGTQALAASATASAGANSDVSSSQQAGQALVARLSQIRATGRIVLQFKPDRSSIDDVPAISLENGDRFVVPFAPTAINVVGAVNDQNSFLYQHGESAGRYLQMAGGPNRNADFRRSFVIRADGSVVSRAMLNGYWGNGFNQLRLNPGDTIVVPDKALRPTALRQWTDWTQIFSQLAIGAAAINVL
jgi:protein involved in polysaccharide export with SLBB domain